MPLPTACFSDYCVPKSSNGSAFYLDDFPSPVPAEEMESTIYKGLSDGYGDLLYKCLVAGYAGAARKYGIRYTGLVIETILMNMSFLFCGNDDIQRFRYFWK